jgi:hypothetical protein
MNHKKIKVADKEVDNLNLHADLVSDSKSLDIMLMDFCQMVKLAETYQYTPC